MCRKMSATSFLTAKQRLDLGRHVIQHVRRGFPNEFGATLSPVHRAEVIRKHDALNRQARWQGRLKRITFGLPGNWTGNKQSYKAIVTRGR